MHRRTVRSFVRFLALAAAVAASAPLSGCSSDSSSSGNGGTPSTDGGNTTPAGSKDIVDTAVAAGSFTKLAAALQAADLVSTLKGAGPFTVFAPTDAAFAKLPAGTLDTLLKPENKAQLQAVLKYHVLAGTAKSGDVTKLIAAKTLFGKDVLIDTSNGVTLIDGEGNKSKVVMVDVLASNGVIHVIDTVLLPPQPTKDIVDTAVAAGSFTKLAAALQAADLVTTLKGAGPFTVFAPTDAAFAKLPAGTLDTLLKPENKAQLQAVLKYHVVSGDVEASDVVKLTSASTLNGNVAVAASASGVTLNGSTKVTAIDVQATNGVIHVIDSVLIPPTM